MATFLTTAGISYHLEELIKGTNERLILISPYLQFNKRIKENIENLNNKKRDIRIIFREDNLQIEDNNWLASQFSLRTSICKSLHAKCYLNENEAIITSMNLYEFSQLNNDEMGIHFTKTRDPELYNSALKDAERLLTNSEKISVTVKKINAEPLLKREVLKGREVNALVTKPTTQPKGFCIRTGVSISFNVEKPMCNEAYASWNKFGDGNYPEKFCHFSGGPSHGETCLNRPILKQNWKKAKEIHGL
jgi:phosphatidylserine/phosphatidylglycerophosphate/cardiolipin synthase-like enzyme